MGGVSGVPGDARLANPPICRAALAPGTPPIRSCCRDGEWREATPPTPHAAAFGEACDAEGALGAVPFKDAAPKAAMARAAGAPAPACACPTERARFGKEADFMAPTPRFTRLIKLPLKTLPPLPPPAVAPRGGGAAGSESKGAEASCRCCCWGWGWGWGWACSGC